jgi:hypothetical protein
MWRLSNINTTTLLPIRHMLPGGNITARSWSRGGRIDAERLRATRPLTNAFGKFWWTFASENSAVRAGLY